MQQVNQNVFCSFCNFYLYPPKYLLQPSQYWIMHCSNIDNKTWPHLFSALTQITLEGYFQFYLSMDNSTPHPQDGHKSTHKEYINTYQQYMGHKQQKSHPKLHNQSGYTNMVLEYISGFQ